MYPQHPLQVVNVSLAGPERDYDRHVTFLERHFHLLREGTGGDLAAAAEKVRRLAADADVVAVTGLREARVAGLYSGDLDAVEQVKAATRLVPVTDGHALRDVLQEWAVRQVHAQMPGYWVNARVVVLGGTNHARIVRSLRDHTENFEFADPLLRLDLHRRVDANPILHTAGAAGAWSARRLPKAARRAVRGQLRAPGHAFSESLARRAIPDSHVIVGTWDELLAFGLKDLRGKTVISSSISDERLAELAALDVDMVLDTTPQPFDFTVSAGVLEAMMIAGSGNTRGALTDDDLLEMVASANLEPRVLYPNGFRRRSRFAFVIHPLSQRFLSNDKRLRTIDRHSPRWVMNVVEKGVAYMPPMRYSRVTGITSPTGAEAEGWLITVGGTPKELMSHSPEFTYAKLLEAAEQARGLGAQIMGLGAFTKVVGDAGVTVAKQACLPITTGNSYSASGALWAAHDALDRLGLAEVDDQGRFQGSAMVVGATGAIGSVCARLLALACDDLYLVSPETAKLLALKTAIEQDGPRARVHIAATPDEFLPSMDVIVTATSGAGKRVLDIMAVKPGCVITDVARPLDLSAADVARRPDVLVVESGEIQLPGDVHMRDIGLPPGVAYACLAETIALALEGRFESFTVGRAIEWERVKEIYQIGLRHGMRLAAISGVNGVFSEEDIARTRELAIERRAQIAGLTQKHARAS
jgi:predicted amino acid dehydrogenase